MADSELSNTTQHELCNREIEAKEEQIAALQQQLREEVNKRISICADLIRQRDEAEGELGRIAEMLDIIPYDDGPAENRIRALVNVKRQLAAAQKKLAAIVEYLKKHGSRDGTWAGVSIREIARMASEERNG